MPAVQQTLNEYPSLVFWKGGMNFTRTGVRVPAIAKPSDAFKLMFVDDSDEQKKFNRASVESSGSLGRFIDRLKSTREPGGESLLDTTQVLFGSGLGSGSRHSNTNLPLILAGGGWKHGQHIDAQRGQPLCNLYLSMLQRMIDAIVERLKSERSGLRDLIKRVVSSETFLTK